MKVEAGERKEGRKSEKEVTGCRGERGGGRHGGTDSRGDWGKREREGKTAKGGLSCSLKGFCANVNESIRWN